MYDLLKGLRVVEGSAFVAAPTCGLYLAQMGAEVIRFDTIGGGPDFRRWPLAENGASLYWEGLNKGKKSVALNLASPQGREIAQRLADRAGRRRRALFVTNFPVDGFLSYDTLKALRDDLICVRVMGWADGSQGMDYTINAALGLPQMTGPADDPRPVNHVLAAWDLLTGAYCAFALVSALLARMRGERRARDPRAAIRRGRGDHGQPRLRRRDPDDRPATAPHGQRPLRRLRPRLHHPRRPDPDAAVRHARQWSQGAGGAGTWRRPWPPLEAELGVSFATDEGLRFTHRARLYPLFERAFAGARPPSSTPAFDAGGVTWGAYQTAGGGAGRPAAL